MIMPARNPDFVDDNEQVVPISHAHKIHAAAKSEQKELVPPLPRPSLSLSLSLHNP